MLSSEQLSDRPASWNKVLLVRELLATYDFVFWVDADAIVIDISRDILGEVGEDADIWFACHPQERDPNATVLNAGVMLVRACDFSRRLLDAVWARDQFAHHNWWENAALLDLLGYSLEPPYEKLRSSDWDERIGILDLAWNSVPGYCESDSPALNHHARSDHDDFDLRLKAMMKDLGTALSRWPDAFLGLRSPTSAGVDGRPRRTHDFEGLDLGPDPTVAELVEIVNRLDRDNETQRLRLIEAFDQLEAAVTEQVVQERRADFLDSELSLAAAELGALHNTKTLRALRPLRLAYARVRRRRG